MIVLTVVGARPQFIKAAAVSRLLRQRHTEILVHTGQHYDEGMSDVFFRDLDLPAPDCELRVGSGTHAEQTARMLVGIEAAIVRERPDVVLVYGDTNSTMAGALAAAKLGVPVAHVEAGCRSYDRSMPEEINRVVTDSVSTLLLCPTPSSVANLAREGITAGVHHVGDVMLDLLRKQPLDALRTDIHDRLNVRSGEYAVATIHRAGNTDRAERLAQILSILEGIECPVVFPVHPRTKKAMDALSYPANGHMRLIEPVPYRDMLVLMRDARMILTDSGGVQKEAFYLSVPCLTLRDTTEWPETVEAGWNRLVGDDPRAVAEAGRAWRPEGPPSYEAFGDGHAGDRITSILDDWSANRPSRSRHHD